ncbi:hypothetical protein [Corynebacterium mendelii]|uniref:hypothetical protein n=1 Tax=Corynebacterium mendelii TaxID=2765362 RepID=UPI001A915DB0|nr:hypothetical protein [Corynebacterium mendelii]
MFTSPGRAWNIKLELHQAHPKHFCGKTRPTQLTLTTAARLKQKALYQLEELAKGLLKKRPR